MALSLEQALGRPIVDLIDAVIAQKAHGYIKHDGEDVYGARDRALEELNSMSNEYLLTTISIGIDQLKEIGYFK